MNEQQNTKRVIANGPLIDDGTFNIGLAAHIIKANWVSVLVASILGGLLSVSYLHLATWKYAIRLYITAVQPTARVSSSLTALTSLANINLGQEQNPHFRQFLAALRSPIAAKSIASKKGVLQEMFPAEWSGKMNRWIRPSGHFDAIKNLMKRCIGIPLKPWAPPGAPQVQEFLKKKLKIIPDEKSGIVLLELDSHHPHSAQKILWALNQTVDSWMRRRELRHDSQDILYLARQLKITAVQELHVALAINLVQQERQKMLASSPLPYVSDPLGAPTISAEPISPRPIAVMLAGVLIGFIVGFSIALRRHKRS